VPAASEAEPTDAQILWDRAENLRQAGKTTAAQKLYRQLAEGEWPPRFNWVRTRARWQMGKPWDTEEHGSDGRPYAKPFFCFEGRLGRLRAGSGPLRAGPH
jgi:hypothetical protein